MSKKLSRRAVFVLAVLQLIVFALLAGLALEVYARWTVAHDAASNPYIRARREGNPWPVPTVDYNRDTFERGWRSRGASVAPLDAPTIAQTWVGRASFFNTAPGNLPEIMAEQFGMRAFTMDSNGLLLKTSRESYSDRESQPIKKYLGGEAAAWVAQQAGEMTVADTVRTYSPNQTPDIVTPGWRFLWRAPNGNSVGFLATDRVVHKVPEQSLWEIPYLCYKVHASDESGKFRTNNVRYRDDDVVLPKPDGVFRILCVGGSTTEEGNFNDVTYPNLLEERLNAQRGSRDIDVVNCGMSGASTSQHIARLSDHLLMEPDMVVIYIGVNDIVHKLFKDWTGTPSLWLARQSLWVNEKFNLEMLPAADAREAGLRESILQRIADMSAYYRAHNVKVAVASFAYPDLENLVADELFYYQQNNREEWGGRYVTFETYVDTMRLYNTLLKEFCEKEKIEYVPVAENIAGGAEYFGDLCHMKNKGIERKAEIIAEHLAPLLPPVSN